MSKHTEQKIEELGKLMGRKFEKIERPQLSQRELNKIATMIDMLKHANED